MVLKSSLIKESHLQLFSPSLVPVFLCYRPTNPQHTRQQRGNSRHLNEAAQPHSILPFRAAHVLVENGRIRGYADVNQGAISSSYSYLISNKTHNVRIFTKFTVEAKAKYNLKIPFEQNFSYMLNLGS